ncbi:ANK1 [Symbiodinium sp. CCMP2592]|nr:ANK1 [Symbiodinium sp. CCMP2592]
MASMVATYRTESKQLHLTRWTDFESLTPEELQLSVWERLQQSNSASTQAKDSDALRFMLVWIQETWRDKDSDKGWTKCWSQLGHLLEKLTDECQRSQKGEHWIFGFYEPRPAAKTCEESVRDIFVQGQRLVQTMDIPRSKLASLDLPASTVRDMQALMYLQSWFVPLAATKNFALLWAGFWDEDPTNRTTKSALFQFADETDHDTVHPDSIMGRLIEESQDLNACYLDDQINRMLQNMWTFSSMSFVSNMRAKAQGTVVAVVNKDLTGVRKLSDSVLFQYEMPTLGIAAWGSGGWSPHIVILDMKGTCHDTSPSLRAQLAAHLRSWSGLRAKTIKDKTKAFIKQLAVHLPSWSRFRAKTSKDKTKAFMKRSRASWDCVDCPPDSCNLDAALAQHIRLMVEAKKTQDDLNEKLFEAVGCTGRLRSEAAEIAIDSRMMVTACKALYRQYQAGQRLEAIPEEFDAIQETLKERKNRLAQSKIRRSFAQSNRLRVVESLLDRKADPNAMELDGRTPLHYAVVNKYLQILEFLLQHKADPNAMDQDGRTPLQDAAKEGHLEAVELLLRNGSDPNTMDKSGQMPLMGAANGGHLKVVELLLKNKADPNAMDQHFGRTPLQDAANGGHLKVVELLLKNKADPNAMDQYGRTPLQDAANGGHLEVVEFLLKNKDDLNATDKFGSTALHDAAKEGHLEVVESLLKNKADPNAMGQEGRTPLLDAANEGHLKVVESLLNNKADPNNARNRFGITPLNIAAHGGHLKVVELLLKNKADPNAMDQDGRTPLQDAANGGHLKVVELLLKNKADPDAMDQDGRTPLHYAANGGHLKVVEVLLKNEADPNAMDQYFGFTALHDAAKEGHLEVVELLLKNKADPNARSMFRGPPLHQAASTGHLKVVELLLKNKADPNAMDQDGRTPLQDAANGGHLKVVELLLKNKADPNATDQYGRTPLQDAANGGHLEVVESLLKNKADLNNATDKFGSTPLHIAAKEGHLEVVELLLKNKANPNTTNEFGKTPLEVTTMEHAMNVYEYKKGLAPLDDAANKGRLQIVKLLENKAKSWQRAAT